MPVPTTRQPVSSPSDAPLPERLHHLLAQWGVALDGQRVVVLGTRRGRLSASLARRGARVLTLREASAGARSQRHPEVRAGLRALPLANAALDLVMDRDAGNLSEARRVLAPGGHVVLAAFEWLPAAPGLAGDCERILAGFGLLPSPERLHGLYPKWLGELERAGFSELLSSSTDHPVAFDRRGWTQALEREVQARGGLLDEDLRALQRELKPALEGHFRVEPLEVPHRLFVAAGRRPQELPA